MGVIICEPLLSGTEHVPFNAGLVQVVAAATEAPVTAWMESEQAAHVRALLPEPVARRIDHVPFEPPPRRLPYGRRAARDAGVAWRIVRTGAAGGARHIVLSSAFPGTILGAKVALASLPAGRRPSVHLVVHGSLAEVWGWRSRNPLRRAVDMAGALAWPAPRGLRIVVLEHPIAQALAAKLPSVADRIVVLEHPIAERIAPATPRRDGTLKVGFLGLASRVKGFDVFCALARAVTARRDHVAFHVVGRQGPTAPDPADLAALETSPALEPLDRATYVDRLADLDLVALLHDAGHYAHTASGVLLDALAAERPILSLPNPLIDALSERFGPLGPRFTDLGAAADWLAATSVEDVARKAERSWLPNLRRAADSRRPAALAGAYAATFSA